MKDHPYAIEAVNIVKKFPGVVANDHVTVRFERGRVHSLLGENGAGKSTLMNVLYGLYSADEGDIFVDGKHVRLKSPSQAIRLGIGMVHQHFMLVPPLSVVENVMLGTRSKHEPILDIEGACRKISELAREYGFDIDPKAKVMTLSVGQRQRVEIIKALYRGAEILILDEPTAVLTPQETRELFAMISTFKNQGKTVIFISHKLNEVMEISDSIVVMRQGKVVARLAPQETSQVELARLMVGRDLKPIPEVNTRFGETVLEVSGLTVRADTGVRAVRDVGFELKSGMILGIAGVDGNGQTELAEAVAGMRKPEAGRIFFKGKDVTNTGPLPRYQMGMAHVPADRMATGLLPTMSVGENFFLQEFRYPPYCKKGILDIGAMKKRADELIAEYDVRTPTQSVPVKVLSGGNLQKVILAREISRNPSLLIAVHPTRGLDVGATEYVHEKMLEQKKRGCAILLISTELDEILELSDVIAVMYEGEIVGVRNRHEVDLEDIGLLMAGAKRDVAKAS